VGRLRAHWRRRSERALRSGTLRVAGELEGGPLDLTAEDLASLPPEHRVADASAYSARASGPAARLAGILARARPRPAAHYLLVSADGGRFRASLFRATVEELGLVLPPRAGAPEAGFELVLPGSQDELARLPRLERLELSLDPGPDSRPRPLQDALVPPVVGAFYPREQVEVDPVRERSWVVPPHFQGEPRIPSPGENSAPGAPPKP